MPFGKNKHGKSTKDVVDNENEIFLKKACKYIGSVAVNALKNADRQRFVNEQLFEMKGGVKGVGVVMQISEQGIKIFSEDEKKIKMAHGITKMAFSTCQPETKLFAYVAKTLRTNAGFQLQAHMFKTKKSAHAQQIAAFVSKAFKIAYQNDTIRRASRAKQFEDETAALRSIDQLGQKKRWAKQEMARGHDFAKHAVQAKGADDKVMSPELRRLMSMLDKGETQRVKEENFDDVHSPKRSSPEMEGEKGKPNKKKSKDEKRQFAKNSESNVVSSDSMGNSSSEVGLVDSSSDMGLGSRDSNPLRDSGRLQIAKPVKNFSHMQSVDSMNISEESYQPEDSLESPVPADYYNMPLPDVPKEPYDSQVKVMRKSQQMKAVENPYEEIPDLKDMKLVDNKQESTTLTIEPSVTPSWTELPGPRTPDADLLLDTPQKYPFSEDKYPADPPTSHDYENIPSTSKTPPLSNPTSPEDSPIPKKANRKLKHSSYLRDTVTEDQLLQYCEWYQGGLTREIAEEFLQTQEQGAFIVRDSQSQPGFYVLTVRIPEGTKEGIIGNYLIQKHPDNFYTIKGFENTFPTLTDLIAHYASVQEDIPCMLKLSENNPLFTERGAAMSLEQPDGGGLIDSDDEDDDPDYETFCGSDDIMLELKTSVSMD